MAVVAAKPAKSAEKEIAAVKAVVAGAVTKAVGAGGTAYINFRGVESGHTASAQPIILAQIL